MGVHPVCTCVYVHVCACVGVHPVCTCVCACVSVNVCVRVNPHQLEPWRQDCPLRCS